MRSRRCQISPAPGSADAASWGARPDGPRFAGPGLRHQVLQLCADVSPVPEIAFAGPVDSALPADEADRLLGLLREALGLLTTPAGQTFICVEAAERLSVTATVTATGRPPVSANGNMRTRDLAPLRERAGQDDIAIEVEPAADGTRLAWSVPCGPRAKVPSPPGEGL